MQATARDYIATERPELRCADVHYQAAIPEGPGEVWRQAAVLGEQLAREFTGEAAALLACAGWKAAVNPVGHVTVAGPD